MLNLPQELFQSVALIARVLDVNSPMTLSALNRRFREVAIGTPTLWTNIHIVHPPYRIDLHLIRSGKAPLDVDISDLAPPVNNIILDAALSHVRQISLSHKLETLFLPKLKPHFHRIGSITMHSVCNRILCEMTTELLAFPARMPSLRSLEMGLTRRYPDSLVLALPNLAASRGEPLPLRSLSLSKIRFNAWDTAITVFFSNSITSLKLTNEVTITISEFKSALKVMSNLETLTIHDPILLTGSWAFPESNFPKPVALPSLREISLLQVWSSDMEGVITLLDVGDRLVKLCLVAKTKSPGDDRPLIENHGKALRSATARNPLLHTLDITGLTVEADDWDNIFRNSPALVTLRIGSSDLDESCLAPLILDAHSSYEGICIHLRNVVLTKELNLGSSAIRKMAKSREREGVKLHSLVLQDWMNPLGEDDVRKIQSAVDEFKVRLVSPYEAVSNSDSDSKEVDSVVEAGPLPAVVEVVLESDPGPRLEPGCSDHESERNGLAGWWSEESWEIGEPEPNPHMGGWKGWSTGYERS